MTCFAGFRETAVPVFLGKELLGFLRTGQILTESPSEADFETAMNRLRQDPFYREACEPDWRTAFFATKVVDASRYVAAVDLLTFFSTQLSAELERLSTAVPAADLPDPVKKASAYLRGHFDKEISLDEVSRVSGLSPHHLCAVFKKSTGQTITDYHNRERIFQAKKRLSSRYARISEVALDVGFGSLSQFNRCFLKFCGESPTDFRKRLLQPK
jgi:AraC-like DNA-binding protein